MQAFLSLFNGLINALRGVTNALQAEGKPTIGFMKWYAPKQKELRTDELLRFIHEARVEDFHQGKHRLRFPSVYIAHFSTDQAGPPPTPDASLVIGTEGPYWIVDRDTPRERRIPIRAGGRWVVQVMVNNAPSLHLGKRMERNDPISICTIALTYLENLVHEAKARFSPAYGKIS